MTLYTAPDKRAYPNDIFLTSPSKHMLWVLIISASMYHNICFGGKIIKILIFFRMKKAPWSYDCNCKKTALPLLVKPYISNEIYILVLNFVECQAYKPFTHKLRQGYRYFKLRKAFLKFYHRHSALVEKYNFSLITLLQQGISEPEFYGDLVYRFRKIVGKSNFSEQFRKLINHYKRIGYSLDIMLQTTCLVINPIIVNGYTSLFNCTIAVRASGSMTASS